MATFGHPLQDREGLFNPTGGPLIASQPAQDPKPLPQRVKLPSMGSTLRMLHCSLPRCQVVTMMQVVCKRPEPLKLRPNLLKVKTQASG